MHTCWLSPNGLQSNVGFNGAGEGGSGDGCGGGGEGGFMGEQLKLQFELSNPFSGSYVVELWGIFSYKIT